jgi:diguanylate cyclase
MTAPDTRPATNPDRFRRLARLRKTDGFYRFGGEEFVVLLLNAGIDAARSMLADLHDRINEDLADVSGGVTVSIGAAEARSGEDWSAWLGRADAALYRAKQAGRDRLVVAGDATEGIGDRRAG